MMDIGSGSAALLAMRENEAARWRDAYLPYLAGAGEEPRQLRHVSRRRELLREREREERRHGREQRHEQELRSDRTCPRTSRVRPSGRSQARLFEPRSDARHLALDHDIVAVARELRRETEGRGRSRGRAKYFSARFGRVTSRSERSEFFGSGNDWRRPRTERPRLLWRKERIRIHAFQCCSTGVMAHDGGPTASGVGPFVWRDAPRRYERKV